MPKTGFVVTAHPGDFVWRAGGAIALHAQRGWRVKILCLSFGERGESQFAWKDPSATLESVKAARKAEAEAAAAVLGAEIEFMDAGCLQVAARHGSGAGRSLRSRSLTAAPLGPPAAPQSRSRPAARGRPLLAPASDAHTLVSQRCQASNTSI